MVLFLKSLLIIMHKIAELLAERIASGLKRKSVTKCSRWACAYRVMGQPFPGLWTFKYHPWLKEMHDSEAEFNIGKKAAQVGYTETVLNISFFNIDVKGIDTLYVLPAQTPDASDFSAARFDPALELSEHLSKLFSDVKNVGHKRAGNTNFYIRGSRSRSGLKSIPTGLIILDEVDEMEQDNIPLAMERASGQVQRMVWMLSTPTVPEHGIDTHFNDSTQEHFMIKCPCCSQYIELQFPDNLVITAESIHDESVINSHLICNKCKGKLPHTDSRHPNLSLGKVDWLSTGKWIPTYTQREKRGFYVNQLYSCARAGNPVELAKSYLDSQRNPASEQEFYNSKLGLAHIVEGAGVLDNHIDDCIKDFRQYPYPPKYGVLTMGIDVGRWIHYEVDLWEIPGYVSSTDLNVQSICRVIKLGKCINFEELDVIIKEFAVNAIVIDANPERRKAYELASRFPGLIKMCFYGVGVSGKQIHIGKDEEPTITVDRTSWLDLSLGRFRTGGKQLQLPKDITLEYRTHIKSLVRTYEKDKTGNPVGKYIKKDSSEDHFAHARNYAEIALPFAISSGNPKNISEKVI